MTKLFLLSILVILILGSCSNEGVSEKNYPLSSLSPTITYQRPSDGSMPTSYTANVEVYSSSNRKAEAPKITQKYQLAVKMIDGHLNLRMNIPGDMTVDKKSRILVSDGMELRILDAATLKVESRTDVSGFDELSSRANIQDRTIHDFAGLIDIERIKAQYRMLSYDITEENSSQGFNVSIPLSELKKSSTTSMNFTSYKLYFDTNSQGFAGSDIVFEQPDGTIVTVVERPLYEEVSGILVKVGAVKETKYERPFTIDTTGNIMPRVDDPKTVPVITQEELEKLKASGATVMQTPMLLGDPSDPDETITESTVYDSIEVDTVDDLYFRVGL